MAEIKGLTIEIGADATSFINQLKQLKSASRDTSNQLNAVNKALKLDPTNVDLLNSKSALLKDKIASLNESLTLTQSQMKALSKTTGFEKFENVEKIGTEIAGLRIKYNELNSEIAETSTKIRALAQENGLSSNAKDINVVIKALEREGVEVTDLKNKLAQLKTEQKSTFSDLTAAKSVSEYNKLNTVLTTTRQQMNALETEEKQVATALNSIKATGTLDGVKNSANSAAGALQTVTSGAKNLASSFAVSVSPMIQQAGRYAIEAANDTDSAYRNMRKTVQGTEEQFEALRQSALRVSSTSVVSADTILNIEAMGGQLGIAVDELETFASVVSNLDIATDMDAETIAEQLGQMANVLKLSNDDLTKFGDSLVRLGNNMPAQESAIMDIASRISSMGSIVGMTTPDILAWSSAIAATGQNSEAAGTAISNTMSDIESACANGGEQLELFAKIAGMSAEDFKTQWDNGGVTTVLKNFITGLNGMEDGGESATAALEGLGITGVRQVQSIEGLMNTVENLDDALTMSNDAWNGVADEWGNAGDAANEAAAKSEGFSGSLAILKNVAGNIGTELADSLTGPLQAITAAMQGVGSAISAMPAPAKTAVAALVAVGAAAGPVVAGLATVRMAFGNVGTSATAAGKNMTAAGKNATSMVSKIKGVAGSVTSLGSVVASVGVAIAGAFITSEIEKYQTRTEQARKSTNLMKDSMSALTSYTPSLSGAMQDAAKSTDDVGTSAQNAIADMSNLRESVALAYDKMIEANTNYANTKGMMDECLAVLQDTNSSYEDAAAAVEIFNAQAGTNLEVVQNAAGGYDILKDGVVQTREQIDQLTASIEAQMLKEMATEQYKEVYQAKAEAIKEQTAAQEELTRAQQKMQELEEAGVTGERWQEQAEIVSQAKAKFDECTQAVNSTSDAEQFLKQQISIANQAMSDPTGITAWVANSTQMQTALQQSGQSLTDFSNSLGNTGVSTQFLGTLTSEQLNQMAANYDGTTSSIISQLVTFAGEVTPQAQAAAQNLKNGMSSEDANIVNNVATLTGLSVDKLYEMGAQCGVAGSDDMAKFAAGIASKQGETGQAVDLNAQEVEQLRSENFDTSSWGSHLGQNFANGIRNAASAVAGAANSIADVVTSILGHTIPKSGPLRNHGRGEVEWGKHLVENFARGMTNNLGLIKQASAKIGKTVDSELNSKRAANFSINAGRTAAQASTSSAGVVMQANSTYEDASVLMIEWLNSNLGTIINQNAPQTIIDNDAGSLIVDNRLQQLQRKAGMNRGY